jgi:ComF family protein
MEEEIKVNPLKRYVKMGLNLLLPALCPACQKPTGGDIALCVACWNELRFIEEPFCKRLAIPFDYETTDDEEQVSEEVKLSPPVFNEARAALLFTETSRRLIHGLKYQDRQELVPLLSLWMARAGRDVIEKADMLIPVPMHRLRFFTRRFNQSAELARALGKRTGKYYEPNLLIRVKKTKPQVGLTHYERAHNLDNAFKVMKPHEIADKNILLIDDVITTGSTLNICAQTLYDAGAREVNVLAPVRVLAGANVQKDF